MINEPLAPLAVSAADHATAAIAPDADLDARWAAWVARGRVHDQRVRRRFMVWASVLAIAAAIVYTFLRP